MPFDEETETPQLAPAPTAACPPSGGRSLEPAVTVTDTLPHASALAIRLVLKSNPPGALTAR